MSKIILKQYPSSISVKWLKNLPVVNSMLLSSDKIRLRFVSLLNDTLQSIALPRSLLLSSSFICRFDLSSSLKLLAALTKVSIFKCKLALHSKITFSLNWKSSNTEFLSFEGTCSILASFTWKNEVRISSDLWQCTLPVNKDFYAKVCSHNVNLYLSTVMPIHVSLYSSETCPKNLWTPIAYSTSESPRLHPREFHLFTNPARTMFF